MAPALAKKFNLKMVVLTRGKDGTVIYTGGQKIESDPVRYPMDAHADAVGAGDACTAGMLVGLLMRWPLDRIVKLANHMGAYVASQPGATPALPPGIKTMLAG